jgi:yecA family protein
MKAAALVLRLLAWPIRGLQRQIFVALGRGFLWLAARRGEPAPVLEADQAELLRPLSEAERARLNRWLVRHRPHDGWVADIHALDGYLACVVVGPSAVPPGEWLGWLFEGVLPAGGEDIVPLMVRHMNEIAAQCAGRPPRYSPVLETHPQLAGRRAPLQAWCRGFMTASVLREAQWQKLLCKGDMATLAGGWPH